MMSFCIPEAAWRKPVQELVLFLGIFWGGSCAIWGDMCTNLRMIVCRKCGPLTVERQHFVLFNVMFFASASFIFKLKMIERRKERQNLHLDKLFDIRDACKILENSDQIIQVEEDSNSQNDKNRQSEATRGRSNF